MAYMFPRPRARLNIGLSPEEKAELDGMSVAEFLAELQVEKEKMVWDRKEAAYQDKRDTSRYLGVSYQKRSKNVDRSV